MEPFDRVSLKSERTSVSSGPWWRIAQYLDLKPSEITEVAELLDFHGHATLNRGEVTFRIEVPR